MPLVLILVFIVLIIKPIIPAEAANMKISHDNGLSMNLLDTWQTRKTPHGFHIAQKASLTFRVPREVEVKLDLADGKPHGQWPMRRDVNERLVHYRVESDVGGSGGESFTLIAWQKCGAGHIRIEQYTQSETDATADFSLAWEVIENLEVSEVCE